MFPKVYYGNITRIHYELTRGNYLILVFYIKLSFVYISKIEMSDLNYVNL